MRRVLIVGALLCASGCAIVNPIHPGAANQFDSASYNTLLVTDSVIKSTRADYVAGKFPASTMPAVKTALNNLIAVYNIADASFLDYHTAVSQGTATTAQVAAVTNSLQQVNTAMASLNTVAKK